MSSPSHNNAIRIAFLVALAGKIISAVLSIILNSPWVFGFGIPLTIMLVYPISLAATALLMVGLLIYHHPSRKAGRMKSIA